MARQGNSEAVGLGWGYRKRREAAIRAMPDGTPCELCGQPMRKKTDKLHYDHVIPRALGGANGPCRIVHAVCNIRAGQVVRVQLQRGRPRPRRPRPAAYNRW
jgi:5-methylcytosine-specific restriction endonuclease McrA